MRRRAFSDKKMREFRDHPWHIDSSFIRVYRLPGRIPSLPAVVRDLGHYPPFFLRSDDNMRLDEQMEGQICQSACFPVTGSKPYRT